MIVRKRVAFAHLSVVLYCDVYNCTCSIFTFPSFNLYYTNFKRLHQSSSTIVKIAMAQAFVTPIPTNVDPNTLTNFTLCHEVSRTFSTPVPGLNDPPVSAAEGKTHVEGTERVCLARSR